MPESNAAQKNGSEWRVIKQPYDLKLERSVLPLTKIILKRDSDGLEVTDQGYGYIDDMATKFTFKGRFGSFEIVACRLSEVPFEPSDVFTVELNSTYLKDEKLGLARSMAKDIYSALMNFPVSPVYNNIPPKNVVFYVNNAEEPRKVMTLEELVND